MKQDNEIEKPNELQLDCEEASTAAEEPPTISITNSVNFP